MLTDAHTKFVLRCDSRCEIYPTLGVISHLDFTHNLKRVMLAWVFRQRAGQGAETCPASSFDEPYLALCWNKRFWFRCASKVDVMFIEAVVAGQIQK